MKNIDSENTNNISRRKFIKSFTGSVFLLAAPLSLSMVSTSLKSETLSPLLLNSGFELLLNSGGMLLSAE